MTSIPQQAPTSGFGLTLTDKAAEEVRKFMTAEQVPADTAGLRVSVLPGGCSGFTSQRIGQLTSSRPFSSSSTSVASPIGGSASGAPVKLSTQRSRTSRRSSGMGKLASPARTTRRHGPGGW